MMLAAPVAQAGRGSADVFIWSIILIIGLIGLFLITVGLKRWLWSTEAPGRDSGFTLSDLREMRRRGELSDEEFNRMRGQIVEAARRSSDAAAGVDGRDGEKPTTELK